MFDFEKAHREYMARQIDKIFSTDEEMNSAGISAVILTFISIWAAVIAAYFLELNK